MMSSRSSMPDADAHQTGQHAAGEQLLLGELSVGGRCRMDDERLASPMLARWLARFTLSMKRCPTVRLDAGPCPSRRS